MSIPEHEILFPRLKATLYPLTEKPYESIWNATSQQVMVFHSHLVDDAENDNTILPQTQSHICRESRKTAICQMRANQYNIEADRKLLHLTCSVTFSHMETLKLHRLCIVDHCGQVWMDVRGSTYIFIRCHPCLFIFYSDQAL